MSQQVQELIDKIKQEGTLVAEKDALSIKKDAQAKAESIIDGARQEAKKIINDANITAEKTKVSGEMALKQASRDVVLSLRQQIGVLLQGIVENDIKAALSAEGLTKILTKIVTHQGESNDIRVTLSLEDLKAVEDNVIGQLQDQLKGRVKFQGLSDVTGGFTVSYDGGKSCFEYTEKSLTEYLGLYLNEQLTELVKFSNE